MSDNPWEGLGDANYELQDIGRPAVFLIPTRAFTDALREQLEQYLIATFDGFQRSDALVSGVYVTDSGQIVLDECVQYEVSFLGKERIPGLARALSALASMLEEECIYLKAGQYTALLHPKFPCDRRRPAP